MTLCRNGLHERTPENTYTYPDGHSQCRVCKRAATRQYQLSPKGVVAMRNHYTRYNHSSSGLIRTARFELQRAEGRLEETA